MSTWLTRSLAEGDVLAVDLPGGCVHAGYRVRRHRRFRGWQRHHSDLFADQDRAGDHVPAGPAALRQPRRAGHDLSDRVGRARRALRRPARGRSSFRRAMPASSMPRRSDPGLPAVRRPSTTSADRRPSWTWSRRPSKPAGWPASGSTSNDSDRQWCPRPTALEDDGRGRLVRRGQQVRCTRRCDTGDDRSSTAAPARVSTGRVRRSCRPPARWD